MAVYIGHMTMLPEVQWFYCSSVRLCAHWQVKSCL